MQESSEELLSDAKDIFDIVKQDAEFDGVMKTLDEPEWKDAVNEALKVLKEAPLPDMEAKWRSGYQEITAEVCPIIFLL